MGELTDDAIAGTFRVWQRRKGHRYSLDDVLTAWQAGQVAPAARRCLDLGSGLGSVLIMLAHALPEARFEAIEAQQLSHELLTRNVERNGLAPRVRHRRGDLRQLATPGQLGGPFDLVTGTPPYVPPGNATPASDSQKAFARQEYRGGVEAYLDAAGRVLAPHGRAVVCGDARFPERVMDHATNAGLRVILRRDAVPRAGSAALFSVFVLQRASIAPLPFHHAPDFVARDKDGKRTAAYHAVRRFFGMAESPD